MKVRAREQPDGPRTVTQLQVTRARQPPVVGTMVRKQTVSSGIHYDFIPILITNEPL